MKLYHGSSTKFDKFKISKELSRNDWESILPEGLGVYMTSDENIASDYGSIIYTIECGAIYDFSKTSEIKSIVQGFLLEFDHHDVLTDNMDTEETLMSFEGVEDGNIAVTGLITEIWDLHEEDMYNLNYNLNLLDYQKDLEKNWQNFLEKKVIKYYCKDFKCNIYISKNVDNIKIL